MTEHLMAMQEGLMTLVTGAPLDVVDNARDREHQGLLGVLPEGHPLMGWEF